MEVTPQIVGIWQMQELIKIRDRIQGEYEDAVDRMDIDNEADGLLMALRMIDERIAEICEEHNI